MIYPVRIFSKQLMMQKITIKRYFFECPNLENLSRTPGRAKKVQIKTLRPSKTVKKVIYRGQKCLYPNHQKLQKSYIQGKKLWKGLLSNNYPAQISYYIQISFYSTHSYRLASLARARGTDWSAYADLSPSVAR